MKKTYQLEDLDCANCAALMEEGIRGLDGVREVSVSFLTQKMVIDIEDGRENEAMKRVVKLCRRIEPDCRVCL